MKCIVCGNRIEEGEDKISLGVDGYFVHKMCQSLLERLMDKIDNTTDAEFHKYLLDAPQKVRVKYD